MLHGKTLGVRYLINSLTHSKDVQRAASGSDVYVSSWVCNFKLSYFVSSLQSLFDDSRKNKSIGKTASSIMF
jgi:hypothetical protein